MPSRELQRHSAGHFPPSPCTHDLRSRQSRSNSVKQLYSSYCDAEIAMIDKWELFFIMVASYTTLSPLCLPLRAIAPCWFWSRSKTCIQILQCAVSRRSRGWGFAVRVAVCLVKLRAITPSEKDAESARHMQGSVTDFSSCAAFSAGVNRALSPSLPYSLLKLRVQIRQVRACQKVPACSRTYKGSCASTENQGTS